MPRSHRSSASSRRLAVLLALAACAPARGPAAPAPARPALAPGLSDADRRWVERTLASLSLREKVAQLVVPWVGGEYAAVDSPELERALRWVEEDRVGGVIVSIGLPHSQAAKLNELQRRARVPLFVMADMENGPGMRLSNIYALPELLPQGGGTNFPRVMALGAVEPEESERLAEEMGRITGIEGRAVGIHMTLAPVMDVNSNPANPIINIRSFGEDPERVGRLGAAFIRGARSAGLMTAAKHFPGHGDTGTDSHIAFPVVAADRARLDAVELRPFRAAVDAGVDGILSAHIAVTGVEGADAPPATLSPLFMGRIPREEMGFRGMVITDAMDMAGVNLKYGRDEALVRALEAGADILLMPSDVRSAIGVVTRAVEAGRVPEGRIDASVRRLLEAKARVGVHRERQVELDAIDRIVGVRAHTEVARRVAERSLTLVRDARNLVPLAKGTARILSVTYTDETDPAAGREFDRALAAAGVVLRSARVDDRAGGEHLAGIEAQADSADAVVVSLYVAPRDRKGSVAAGGGVAGVVERLSRAGKPVVAVSFGSPYLLDLFPSVPAYLLAWGRAEVAQRAAAHALRGEIPIRGRLPVSLPPHHALGAGLRREAATGGTR
ncbi:MAG TPA: glycoside hydrolase family 3 N-terminal domain-containing protein [Longimicrobiaceae bacterium]|nr:glycoside hydrolase family 3 N-terminal domain-containing protein [Longimicrobiaceae bacterium]